MNQSSMQNGGTKLEKVKLKDETVHLGLRRKAGERRRALEGRKLFSPLLLFKTSEV